jgi:hypothetical protein
MPACPSPSRSRSSSTATGASASTCIPPRRRKRPWSVPRCEPPCPAVRSASPSVQGAGVMSYQRLPIHHIVDFAAPEPRVGGEVRERHVRCASRRALVAVAAVIVISLAALIVSAVARATTPSYGFVSSFGSAGSTGFSQATWVAVDKRRASCTSWTQTPTAASSASTSTRRQPNFAAGAAAGTNKHGDTGGDFVAAGACGGHAEPVFLESPGCGRRSNGANPRCQQRRPRGGPVHDHRRQWSPLHHHGHGDHHPLISHPLDQQGGGPGVRRCLKTGRG